MALKGLSKISIPSKLIKIVHAISPQNDSPQLVPNPIFFALRTFTIFHQEPPLQNDNPLNVSDVSISVTFSPFDFERKKTKGIL